MKTIELSFPLLGMDEGWSAAKQPPLTSPSMCNVRPYDVQGNRARGGQRPGLKKIMTWESGKPAKNLPVIALAQITVSSYDLET